MSNTFNYNDTINRFKATDCGAYGKAFEINVKHYLNGNRGNSDVVSSKGKIDVKYKGFKIEIKSNCGELDDIFNRSAVTMVIYTMNNRGDYATPEKARVIPASDFLDMIELLDLSREKRSTNGYMRTTIQSYANSKKKATRFAEALAKYPTLAEWVESL